MTTADRDRAILRGLAGQVAEIAALPRHEASVAGWKRINDLRQGKPMIYIYQIPWHEMDVNGELTLQTQDPFCRDVEQALRRTIYQWRHMPGDMVVEDVYSCTPVFTDSGNGLDEDVDIVKTDESNDVVSRHFHVQIRSEDDLELIKMPVIDYDAPATVAKRQRLDGLFGDILPITQRGVGAHVYNPWDLLVRLWGVQEALMDLVVRPGLAHQAMDRLTTAFLSRLDQFDRLNLLDVNNRNITSQGGLGYTDDLPPAGYDPDHVHPEDIWGGAMSQIFSAVSPEMHEEFAAQYEARYLNRFGLCYYGCCEPLDLKVEMLRRNLPRLRKISMSPWVDLARGAEAVGRDLVFSYKPSPAVFAEDVWQPEYVRQEMRKALATARGCSVEIILKDISTVRYHPERLWEWAEVVAQVADEFA